MIFIFMWLIFTVQFSITVENLRMQLILEINAMLKFKGSTRQI
jgi:hypothetical protein